MYKKISILFLAVAFSVVGALAQDTVTPQNTQIRSAVSGQKYKVKGVIVAKEAPNTFIVRDSVGVDTRVVVTPNASVKNNSFWGGDKYPIDSLVRGLNLEVEGRGDNMGNLSATKVRFEKSNLDDCSIDRCSRRACGRANFGSGTERPANVGPDR